MAKLGNETEVIKEVKKETVPKKKEKKEKAEAK